MGLTWILSDREVDKTMDILDKAMNILDKAMNIMDKIRGFDKISEPTGSRISISVQAEALGGREVVDTPPAHLEKDEGEYQQEKMAAERLDGGLDRRTSPRGRRKNGSLSLAQMQVQKIAEPSGGGPGLFRIPCPVVSPCLLGP